MKTVEQRMLEKIKAGELEPANLEAAFDELLDECYSFEKVGGPFKGMSPSNVLRLCDETAYRCGVSEMGDDCDRFEEFECEFYNVDELQELREECQLEFDDEQNANPTE